MAVPDLSVLILQRLTRRSACESGHFLIGVAGADSSASVPSQTLSYALRALAQPVLFVVGADGASSVAGLFNDEPIVAAFNRRVPTAWVIGAVESCFSQSPPMKHAQLGSAGGRARAEGEILTTWERA
jgi:hypothetical protein